MEMPLRGPNVTLRPFRAGEAEIVWREEQRDAGPLNVGRGTSEEARRAYLERAGSSGAWTRFELLCAVEAGGKLAGDIQARRSDEAMPPGVFEIGLALFGRARRKGYGREATALMTMRLFEVDGAIRVQATTDVENVPMRRLLEGLGYVHEGVLRGFMPTPDGPRDYAIYGMTTTDYEDHRPTWT